MLEERSGIPVVGVAPYLQIEVEDEDSLTERFDLISMEVGQIDIAVIRVPRISNFTDFNPFENIPGVSLRYVKHIHELKHPDMVILPELKIRWEICRWMRESGMDGGSSHKLAAAGNCNFRCLLCGYTDVRRKRFPIRTVCEAGGTMKGMGLLPMDTVICRRKDQNQSQWHVRTGGRVNFPNFPAWSWKDMRFIWGVTTLHEGASPLTTIRDHAKTQRKNRMVRYTSRVYGTYVHGVFDKEGVAEAVIRALGEKKGIDTSEMKGVDFQTFKETQYDILGSSAAGTIWI